MEIRIWVTVRMLKAWIRKRGRGEMEDQAAATELLDTDATQVLGERPWHCNGDPQRETTYRLRQSPAREQRPQIPVSQKLRRDRDGVFDLSVTTALHRAYWHPVWEFSCTQGLPKVAAPRGANQGQLNMCLPVSP